jgi:hypothetical protein
MWKKKDHTMPLSEKAILTGMLAGYFVHNIFVFDNLTSYILFFAFLAYITVRTREELPTHGHPLFDKDQMNLLIVPIIAIMLLVTQYYINYRPFLVNRLVIRGMSFSEYAKTMPFADAVKIQQDAFTTAIAMNTLGSIEAREQFLQIVVRMSQIKVPDELPQGEKQATVQALNNLILAARKDVNDSFPKYKEDVRMLSIYGMFFNGTGDSVSGEQVLSAAHTLAPNKQLVAFDLIRAYLIQKKFQEAYALGRQTYDLSITCHDADKWYLVSAAYAGKYPEAKEYILSKGKTVTTDPDVIAGVINAGQIPLAIQLLQDMKKENPALAPQIDDYIKQMLLAPKK